MAMALRTPNKSIGLIGKQTTLHVQHTFLYINFFEAVLPDCVVKLPSYMFCRKEGVCVPVHFFSTDAHASLKHFSFCHFPIKLSCLPLNEIHLL